MGDQTSHGSPLGPGPGSLDVLIGGKPAWRAMSDAHVCPLSDGPKPHTGGSILVGSKTVIINNLPAVRVGDFVTEAGPPNPIVSGEPTVVIGDSSTASSPPNIDTMKNEIIDLVGHVTDFEGNPLSNVEVKVIRRDGSLYKTLRTDSNGRYQALDVPDGDYHVIFEADDTHGGRSKDVYISKGMSDAS